MKVHRIIVGSLETNCYLIRDNSGVIIVDPGAEGSKITDEIRKLSLKPIAIVFTHGHWDHIGGTRELLAQIGNIPTFAHTDEIPFIEDPNLNLSIVSGETVALISAQPIPDNFHEYDFDMEVIHLPGHTPGSIGLYSNNFNCPILFSGDTILGGGAVGRTDLPGGDEKKLIESIEKILLLPDKVTVYPGHGGRFVLGHERKSLERILKELKSEYF